MHISGRRIQIAGSANPNTDPELIRYGHELIRDLVLSLAAHGATFVVGVGKEPALRDGDPSSPSIVFGWTALAAACASVKNGAARATGEQGGLVVAVATDKTDRQVPVHRRPIWEDLLAADAVDLQFAETGWTSGAVRRAHQARLGDILLGIGGGEGVEHLAQLYAEAAKPIIMLDLNLGASTGDGSGGAARLAARARAHPEQFVRLRDSRGGGALLANITTREGTRPVAEVVRGVLRLIEALAPPTVFYVRLLNARVGGFAAVDRFFGEVVDPTVREFGFEPVVVDRGVNEYAWMNVAIFESLHHSAVAVVDLTGLRNNCFMELGYALGRAQRVLITAKAGTRLPFDAQMIESHRWTESKDIAKRREAFRTFWRRNINRPPIVKPRSIL
jgi:hypothetical protein